MKIMPLRLCAVAPLCLFVNFVSSKKYMRLIYNIGILIYEALARILSPFNTKARLWINGRKNWYDILRQKVDPESKYIWMHCASLGEFEQGRPLIEAIKGNISQYKIVLTFFSPSGYEIRKNYQQADIVCYLPSDTPDNAENFINLIKPEKVIFVKYEFWYNFISVLGRRNIPLYLISGIFREKQYFFKWYGSFFRQTLKNFTTFYVQDQQSADLLKGIGLDNATVAGDTRFDRVRQIADNAKNIPQLEQFRNGKKLFLAGSSWKKDEEIIAQYINKYPDRMKWIFAPHEIDRENIDRLCKLFRVKCVRFSEFKEELCDAKVLIIDNIGMLSSAYRYAYIAAVGGGFGKGIHNILEAACWGIPVLFGPNHLKFREAVEMKKAGSAKSFTEFEEFETILNGWLTDDALYKKAAENAGKYIRENIGATHKIMKGIT